MAADANLIKGAAAAYGAGTAAKQTGGDALGSMAAGLIERVDARTADVKKKTDEAKERRRAMDDKFFDNQEKALLQGGALGTAEFDLTERKVKGLKKQYDRCALGDDACQRKVMMQLSQESQALTAMKDTRKLNAEAMSTLRSDVTQDEKHIMGVFSNSMSGEYTIDEDALGEKTYTFKMPDGSDLEMPANEVQRLFDKQQDAVGSKATKDMALAEIKRGQNGEAFDEYKTAATFDNLLKDDNSFMSALHDDWGVGNFSASIDNKIANEIQALNFAGENLASAGISMPLEDGEANWYEKISMKDAGEIKRRLMNPTTPEEKEATKKVLKQYYVDAMKQQHEQGKRQTQQAALAKQKEDEFTLYKETHKNNLRIALENAKDENERRQISIKFANDMTKKAQDHYNNVNEETDKLAVQQSNAESQWNAITFDKGEKPVSKAQTYMENFRDILGDDVTDIRYGTNFVDEQGNTQAKGYYAVINVDDGKGGTKEVNQLISKSDDLTYDNVNRYLDPEKMRVKKQGGQTQAPNYSPEQVAAWLEQNPDHPQYEEIKQKLQG